MASTQFRWAILLIVVSTLILVIVLSVVVLPYRFKGEYDTDFGQKYPELANLISTKTLSSAELLSTPTPLPRNAKSDLAIATVTLQPNCTRSALYWVNHPELWPEKIDLGSALFTKMQALQIIHSTVVDVSSLVFIQFVSAYLNVIHGADPLAVADVIMQASDWVYNHPPGGLLQEAEAQKALSMAKELEDYNSGYLGPYRCLDDTSSYTDQVAISVPVLLMTPSSIMQTSVVTPTPLATYTALPTRTPMSIMVTYAPPTASATPKPPKPSGSNPTSPPATQRPDPTQEPPPPTHEPPPPTQEPPPPPPPPTQRPDPTEPPPPPPTEPPPPNPSSLE
jgi:hypothetical protein